MTLASPVRSSRGSSPLTRGKHDARLAGEILEGLIPAHAGKTARMGTTRVRRRAHPRSRGENRSVTSRSPSTRGSSPLTRGKRWRAAALICAGGLIPAHAGKTPVHGRAYGSPWAHPRSRGENPTVVGRHLMVDGSSPLTRGKLGPAGSGKSSLGLIPAHAGKTCAYLKYPPIFRAHPRSRGENELFASCFEDVTGSSPLTRGKPQAGRPA